MPDVRLDALVRRYPGAGRDVCVALDRLTLSIADREFLVVVGPSGSGKTTLLRLIAGLESPDAGTVHFGTRSMNDVPPRDRGVAMVFQDHPLLPHLTIGENLGFGLRLRRTPAAEIARRVGEVAELVGIGSLRERRPETLSGGERQRVALGTALVGRPDILLLDEPFAQLDAPLRAQLRAELRRLQRELGITLIHVTHDQSEAMALGDRLAILRRGELVQTGPPLAIYQRPASTFAAEFLGSPGMNLLRGTIQCRGRRALFTAAAPSSGEFLLPPESGPAGRSAGDLVLGVRPEGFVIGGTGDGAPGLVIAVEPLGHETLVRVRVGAVEVVVRTPPESLPGPGANVGLRVVPGAAHWFDAGTGLRLER